MNMSAVRGRAVGLGLLLLLVVCDEARMMNSNGSSSCMWLHPFYSESVSILSAKTSSIKTASVASEMNEDELHVTVCEPNESPSRHQVEENWFPDTTYERNRLEFNTTQNNYERQSNSVRVLSYERLYSRSKVRVRLDSKFRNSFERREADLKRKPSSKDRDDFGRSGTRSRESRSKGRGSLDQRTTRLKSESRKQVRDGSDRFQSRMDSRHEGRSSLHRRMADLKREFRFQGIHHDIGRSDLGLWKESRTEGRSSLDRSGRMADLKKHARNIARDGFERSYSRMKSRSEVSSVLGRRVANLTKEFQNQVRYVFDLRNEFRGKGRSSQDRRPTYLKRVYRNQVGDGLEILSALRSTFRNKGRSSLNRRMADLKNFKSQVRDGFERHDLRKESRSEGRRIADFKMESRRQVRSGFERHDLRKESRSEGRRIADFKMESRRQVRSGFERSDSRMESKSEGRRIADFKMESRKQVRSGFERSDLRRNSRSEDRSSLGSRMTDLRKASDLSQVRDVAGKSDSSMMEFRHEGRRRLERIATDSTRKLKRGVTRHSGVEIRSNLNLKAADSNRHRSQLANRTEWILIPHEFPLVHNSDVGQQLDGSVEYLQNHEMDRRTEQHCVHTIIDKELSYCSSDISLLSFNDYRLEGWFRKENDTYDYSLPAVSLLSVGAPNPIASAPFMMAS